MAPRISRNSKLSIKNKVARANLRGYAARQAKKAASSSTSSNALDVYEYTPNNVRRATVPLTLDREEKSGPRNHIEDEDEEDSVRDRIRRQIANGEEEGVVMSDEDEEIDSDGAFEDESDEERFASFKFRESADKDSKGKGKAESTRKSMVTFAVDVDLGEDDEGGTPTPRRPQINSDPDGETSEGEEDEDDEGKDEETGDTVDLSNMLDQPASSDSDSGAESDDALSVTSADDPSASAQLASFISTLDTSSKKRKPEDKDELVRKKRRTLAQEKTEAGPEGEFGARSGPQQLTLTDLLSSAPQLSKSTKALQSTTKSALAAPLAQRTRDRLDREAAYVATKEEIQKWAPTMKRIREAEHLAFPLQGPGAGKGVANMNAAERFQPSTPMESAISSLLRAAHLYTDAETAATENTLAAATLSPEDLAARRAQLRATRELMFRADVKAKRVARIKSKTYRRMKKREREKLAELGMEGDGDDEEERKKAEAARAKERATLRHRTTGKWAKAMRRKGELGDEDEEGMQTLVDRSEVLRRKIAGEESSDDDDEGEGDAKQLEELAVVDDHPAPEKGIMGMKFMRDAAARAERNAAALADEARLELLGLEKDTDMEAGNPGRRIYNPGQTQSHRHTYSEISSTLKSSQSPSDTPTPLPSRLPSPPSNITSPVPRPVETSNPWLVAGSSSLTSKRARKFNVGEQTRAQKVLGKSEEERAKAKEDAVVEIDMAQVMVIPEPGGNAKNLGKEEEKTNARAKPQKADSENKNIQVQVDSAYRNSDEDTSDVGESRPTAFKQRELVAMAFAGDNVVEDFLAEKQRVIEEDAPKELDTTLPGWGSWGGRGTKKQAPRPNLVKKIAGVDASKRADAGKAHIIISERKDKKAAKYLVKDLPYPYTSKEQFARSMATPIGTEWNTRVAHQRATLPRVVKKMGTVIEPLEKLF